MSQRRVPFRLEKLKLDNLAKLPEPEGKSNAIDWLGSVSEATLQDLMLARMSQAANLRKAISDLIDEMTNQLADAKLAEQLIEQKRQKREGQ